MFLYILLLILAAVATIGVRIGAFYRWSVWFQDLQYYWFNQIWIGFLVVVLAVVEILALGSFLLTSLIVGHLVGRLISWIGAKIYESRERPFWK